MTSKVIDRDRGWNAIRQLAAEVAAKKPHVVAGLVGERAGRIHAGGAGLTVVEIGTKHEFGLGVPERSFVRATFDQHAQLYRDLLKRQIRAEIMQTAQTQQPFSHKRSKALNRVGLKMVGDMQKRISAHIPPPNSPVTIARKGSSTPLIDTGQLRGAISYEVRP